MTQARSGRAWDDRAPEVAHLLNPAFLGEMLVQATSGYQRLRPEGLPFTLAFLVPAIVLPGTLRRQLPRSSSTRMLTWLTSHPEVRVRFADRVRHLAPHTRAGLTLAGAHGLLRFSEDGAILPGQPLRRDSGRLHTDETRECLKRAGLVGEWFAAADTPNTIFDAWGIRP